MEINPVPAQTAPAVEQRSIPLGVKIIAVLYYIGSVIEIFGAIIILVSGSAFLSVFIKQFPGSAIFGGILYIISFVFIALGILSFFIGRHLWQGRPWARTLVFIFAILGMLSALSAILKGQSNNFISLILNGIVVWYIWFSAEAKAFFSQT